MVYTARLARLSYYHLYFLNVSMWRERERQMCMNPCAFKLIRKRARQCERPSDWTAKDDHTPSWSTCILVMLRRSNNFAFTLFLFQFSPSHTHHSFPFFFFLLLFPSPSPLFHYFYLVKSKTSLFEMRIFFPTIEGIHVSHTQFLEIFVATVRFRWKLILYFFLIYI